MKRSGRERNAGSVARGATSVELVVSLVVLLLLGLGLVQLGMIYSAKAAIDHAIRQAAREGATAHASGTAIQRGLARGLAPYLFGASDAAELRGNEARAREHVNAGLAAGWIGLVQRSPTRAAFDDWGEPARGPFGEPIDGLVEIPNDNLDSRRLRTRPAGGVAGDRAGEPVGARSGQSLAEANLLRLELTYGLKLVVPLAGPAIAAAIGRWHRCAADAGQAGSAADLCGQIAARPPRLPLRSAAVARMMSTARPIDALADVAASNLAGFGRPGTGSAVHAVHSGSHLPAPPAAPNAPNGSTTSALASGPPQAPAGTAGSGGADADTADPGAVAPSAPVASVDGPQANGFLRFGSDRAYRHPALCDADAS